MGDSPLAIAVPNMPNSQLPERLDFSLMPRTLLAIFSQIPTSSFSLALGSLPAPNWAKENCSAPESDVAPRTYVVGAPGILTSRHPGCSRTFNLGVVTSGFYYAYNVDLDGYRQVLALYLERTTRRADAAMRALRIQRLNSSQHFVTYPYL